MKKDLDALMQKYGLYAVLITGPAQHNPAMVYMTGVAHLSYADVIKKRGSEPVLVYYPMERDEAAKSGLATKSLADYPMKEWLQQTGGDTVQAMALRYQKMLADQGITAGRVALYGQADAGSAYAVFSCLKQLAPDLELVGEMGDSMLREAMATKDEAEVERIRRMGEITTGVVGQTADFLTSQRVQEGVLVKGDGSPLTIRDVKSRINLWLAERGAENPEGTIFSIGRDAAIPHSSGNPGDLLRLGQTIVFDIFPCEAEGGYYYDLTRTWCLGYAPDEVLTLYEDVRAVYNQLVSELKPAEFYPHYHHRACQLFEQRGHPTIDSDRNTQNGYVHGLGHGVGLYIHERPLYGDDAKDADRLNPGTVFTIEPGLYYPERGMGIRLEDTFWVRPDGQIQTLAEFPLDLILPVQ